MEGSLPPGPARILSTSSISLLNSPPPPGICPIKLRKFWALGSLRDLFTLAFKSETEASLRWSPASPIKEWICCRGLLTENFRRHCSRTYEVGTTKSSGNQNGNPSTVRSLDSNVSADVGENFLVAHSLQRQFTPVAVSGD